MEKERVKDYRDLVVWQKAIKLAKNIYLITHEFPKHELYGLADQLRRAAVSIPSNIAEGQSRQHTTEFRQFLHIALGSSSEVDTQVVIAFELGYITSEQAEALYAQISEIRRMLRGLISSLK